MSNLAAAAVVVVGGAERRSMVGTLQIRLPKPMREALERKANLEGNKVSATARRILSIGLRADARNDQLEG